MLCIESRIVLLLHVWLLQGELDRFQDTVRLLKDYYKGMDGQIPDELDPNYERLPLIEVGQNTLALQWDTVHFSPYNPTLIVVKFEADAKKSMMQWMNVLTASSGETGDAGESSFRDTRDPSV